jgi:hypothetical protein
MKESWVKGIGDYSYIIFEDSAYIFKDQKTNTNIIIKIAAVDEFSMISRPIS